MADSKLNVSVSASIKGLTDGLAQATSAIKHSTDTWVGSFSGIGRAIDGLKAPFLAISAVLAGGKMFKDALAEAGKWNLEAARMARTLGITTQEASALNLALEELSIQQDTYVKASSFLTRQIVKGGDAFHRLGIDIRGADGNLRPMTDLMAETLSKLNGLKAGVDRNAAGLSLFGRGWNDAQVLLRLTTEEMEQARKKATELGLVVGPEGAAMAREYKRSMNEVNDAHKAIQVQLGNQLMPVFAKMSKMMAEEAPVAARAFAGVLKGVGMGFMALKFVIETITTAIATFVMTVVDGTGSMIRAFLQVQRGEFVTAVETLQKGASDVKRDWVAAGENISASWAKTSEAINEIWDPTKLPPAPVSKADGRYDPETDADKKEAAGKELAAALALAKAKEQIALASLMYEETLLEEEVAANKKTVEEELQARLDLEQQRYYIRRATLNAIALLEAGDPAKRAAIDAQLVQLEADYQKKLSTLRRAGVAEVAANAQAEINARRKMAEAGIEYERNAITTSRKLNDISAADELEALMSLERQKYALVKQSLEAQLALKNLDAKKRKEVEAELFQLEQDYNAKRLEMQTELTLMYREQVEKFIDPFVQGFTDGLKKILDGTITFKDAIKGLFGMLRQALAQSIAGMVADWLAGLAKKLAAWITTKATELLFYTTTEEAKTTVGVANSVTRGTASAVEGGIAAGATAAATPGIGWMIALPVAGAVIGALLAYLAMASAAGGYDIPSGVNPLVQTHEREMILPAKYADVIRGLAGGEASQGGGPVNVSITIKALDGADVQRVLTRNEGALLSVLTKAARRGRI